MCGICGIISSIPDTERRSVVREMNSMIIHRGPDEDGFFDDDHCSLAMRRLAIIDLPHGRQPIYSYNDKSLILFNGEIYNFRDLRAELLARGIPFKTNSDTEVIVNAYAVWGEQAIAKLKGMFVFCIYDIEKGKWIFARDRFGEKPLYYYHRDGHLSFSSDVGSLLRDPAINRRLNIEVLPSYLTLSYVPEPDTLIKDVYTLRPGHFLCIQNGELVERKYFEHGYSINENVKTFKDAVDVVKPVWEAAVKRQMVADVPLGAFLSGGIDSSTVVATMQKFSASKVKTFTVRFEDESYDESPIARKVSEKVGTDHHEITVKNAGFRKDIFWELIGKIGVPFPDSSALPSYFVTKEIRKHVKVALSGDGGDELFGGYSLFGWHNSIYQLKALPQILRHAVQGVLHHVQRFPGGKRISQIRQIKKAFELSSIDPAKLPVFLHALFSEDEIARLMPGVHVNIEPAYRYPAEFKDWSPLRRIMHFRLIHNLPLDMLTKVDRMSMANSLEVRAPFLDADLFDVAATIPEQFLFDRGKGKLLIREMMKYDLPSEVFNHPKKGFSIPLHKYQNEEFNELVNDLLLETDTLSQVFDKRAVRRLVERNSSVVADNAALSVYKASHQVWSLLQLSGWISYYKISV